LIILGAVAIAITLLAPGGLWGLITRYRPMALFGIQRRLVIEGAASPPPPSGPMSPAGPGGHD
jgi:hypothetical protein